MNHFDEPEIHAALEREERRFNASISTPMTKIGGRPDPRLVYFDPAVMAEKKFAVNTPNAARILTWLLKTGLDHNDIPRSGFMGSMIDSLCEYRGLTDKQWAAVVKSYSRWAENVKANKGKTTVGAIGETITVPVTLISRKETEGQWGINYMHIFHTCKDKNVVKCWSRHRTLLDLDIGQEGLLRGTVSMHGDWNGLPETVVKRPKLVK